MVAGFPIKAFVGPNGHGKTLALVHTSVVPAWQQGRVVVANMELDPTVAGFDADLYLPLGRWQQLVTLGTCAMDPACAPGSCEHSSTRGLPALLVLDDISAAFPSRQSQSMPPQVLRVLNQLRKTDVVCAWSGPAWDRADVSLRQVTQSVTLCQGMVPDRFEREPTLRRFPAKAKSDEGEALRANPEWRPNRLFRFRTYEAMSYEDFTLAKSEKVRPLSTRWLWRSRHVAAQCYGTLDQVLMLDHLDDVGSCMECGGTRARAKCRCSRPEPGDDSEGAPSPGGSSPVLSLARTEVGYGAAS